MEVKDENVLPNANGGPEGRSGSRTLRQKG